VVDGDVVRGHIAAGALERQGAADFLTVTATRLD